ncbi:hypothetical protein MKEN_00866200 [Mycena kentingensis (nom. inval.)]|nr:hypothetical protein MKEN_00866200 [Mycena kentingensis (nom. inval.)]
MFIKFNTVFVLAALLFAQGQATPAPTTDGELVLLSTEETPTGTITIWGIPEDGTVVAARDPEALEKRQCGTNNVTCSGDHTADRNACNQLVSSLSANSGQGVGTSPRSICQTVNGNQCCVSWANPVNGLTQGNLVPGAQAVLNGCGGNSISGLTRNTNLNGICTTQCLSNRATGCS